MRPITLICALAATMPLLPTEALAAGGWAWPVRGPVLTPYRNGGDPYAAGQHRGIDIGAPVGRRVVAAVGGRVTFAGVVGSSGLTVSERSADERFDLSYLHLSAVAVHLGDVLAPGAAVGAVGTSGRRSVDAPHLHFGVREAGTRDAYRDPLDFLARPIGGNAPDPEPAPVPVAHPAAAKPARARVGSPHAGAAPHPAGAPAMARHVLHTAAEPRPRHVARPAAAPEVLRGPSAATATPPAHATTAPAPRRASHGSQGGVNAGWLVACLALIAAAVALGRPDTTRRLAARSRARVGGLLRPAGSVDQG